MKKRIFKTKKTNKNFDKRIKKLEQLPELKWLLTDQSTTDNVELRSAGTVYNLTNPTLGAGASSRIGAEIHATSVQIRWILFANEDNTKALDATTVRIMIFRDRQANQTNFSASLDVPFLLDNVTNGPRSVLSPLSIPGKSRFKVYYDKLVSMTPQVGTHDDTVPSFNTYSYQKHGVFKKKLSHKIEYDATGAILPPKTNAIFLYFFADAAFTDTGVKMAFQAKVIYKDS